MQKENITLGVVISNRDFFPDKLVSQARTEIIKGLGEQGIQPILLGEHETNLGGVETHQDARKCADLFTKHKKDIAGILIVLPNFGDERSVADTLHLADLKVPVLIQGYPDDLDKLNVTNRRDAWCGKISVCNNLYQYGIRYSLSPSTTMTSFEPVSNRWLIVPSSISSSVTTVRPCRSDQ